MKWVILFPLLVVLLEATNQTVKVTGVAICNRRRQINTTVELWERDKWGTDDLMATIQTDREGEFSLEGSNNEIGTIEPYIVFKHKCHVENQKCKRHTEYVIPQKFIDSEEWYDMSFVGLNARSTTDKEKCN